MFAKRKDYGYLGAHWRWASSQIIDVIKVALNRSRLQGPSSAQSSALPVVNVESDWLLYTSNAPCRFHLDVERTRYKLPLSIRVRWIIINAKESCIRCWRSGSVSGSVTWWVDCFYCHWNKLGLMYVFRRFALFTNFHEMWTNIRRQCQKIGRCLILIEMVFLYIRFALHAASLAGYKQTKVSCCWGTV